MSLESLPFELLQYICTFFESSLIHLKSLSLANHRCRSATIAVLFRSITFASDDKPEGAFEKRVEFLSNILHSVGEKHVRELEIDYYTRIRCTRTRRSLLSEDNDCDLEEISSINPKYIWNDEGRTRPHGPLYIQQGPTDWLPLARLIEKLPNLSHLIWSHPTSVPSCVITSLHSRCKLHLPMFCFSDDVGTVEQYAKDIAPVLSSVCVQFPSAPPSATTQITDSVRLFLEMVVGTAPKLRDVRASFGVDWDTLRPRGDFQLERGLRSLMSTTPTSSLSLKRKLRRLVRFEIGEGKGSSYTPAMNAEHLQIWTEFLDMSSLQTFHLAKPSEDTLVWLTAHRPFTGSLKTLMLHVEIYPLPEPQYTNAVDSFVASLPPLRALRLEGGYSLRNLQTSTEVHGSSLRKLWALYNFRNQSVVFDLDLLKDLRLRCPNLEDLRLTIRRTKGDSTEVAMYNILGSFPFLTTIVLTLECSNPNLLTPLPAHQRGGIHPPYPANLYPPGGTSPYPLANRPTRNDVRDSLINAAVDSTLARSIYTTISRSKHPSSRPLKQLTIHPTGGGTFANRATLPGLPECFWRLERKWRVRRESGTGDIEIEETGDVELRPWKKEMRLQRALREIFEGFWPVEGKGDWRRVWWSFPLYGEDEGEESGVVGS